MSDKVLRFLGSFGVVVSLALMATVLIVGTLATAISIAIVVGLVFLLGISGRALWMTYQRELPR